MKKTPPPLLSEEILQKYLDQTLSPAEMHAVEKAMLDAPLQSEALEGWITVPEASPADLADLQARLRARVQAAQRPVERRLVPLLRVAAAVVALVVAGWWAQDRFGSNGPSNQLAENSDKTSAAEVAPAPADSTFAVDLGQPLVADQLGKPEATATLEKRSERIRPRQPERKQTSDIANGPVLAGREMRKQLALNPQKTQTGEVDDEFETESEVVKSATVATNQPNEQPKPLVMDERNKDARRDNQESTTKKSKSALATTTKEEADEGNIAQAALPLGGWEAFRAFIAQSAKAGPAGRVELEVQISQKGKVGKITLIKSLDKARDREAQRLIGQYQGWQPATRQGQAVTSKLVVEVDFN